MSVENKPEKIVIVAGAGISKESPANLPSWWEYNMLLLKTINELAALELPGHILPLDQGMLEKYIPVVSVSDYIERGAMGRGYFPLLKLLEGSQPNNNHYALAELAKSGKIAAIITTNFDTLIEQAFTELNAPYNIIITDEEFKHCSEEKACAILKIHGSVTSEESLIDTVTQKMRGLSAAKRNSIKRLFRKYPAYFIGFSGDDFRFNEDYIPISEALKHHSVYWIKHPGGSINPFVESMTKKDKFKLEEMELASFFKNWGINAHFETTVNTEDNVPFCDVALPVIRGVMDNLAFGSMGCLGLCLRLLDDIGETSKAMQFSDLIMERLKTEKVPYNGFPAIILLFNIGIVNMRRSNFDTALYAFLNEKQILIENMELMKKICTNEKLNRTLDECGGNLGAVWINIGLCHFNRDNPGDLESAVGAFNNALQEYTSTLNYRGCVLAAFNLAQCKYKKDLDFNLYMKTLSDLSKRARSKGDSHLLIDILLVCVNELTYFGEYDSAWKRMKEAEEILEITISLAHRIQLHMNKANLYIRRNQHKECRGEFTQLFELLEQRSSDMNMKVTARFFLTKLLGCYEEHKDIVRDSLVFLLQNASFVKDFDVNVIEEAIRAVETYGRLFSQPLFLNLDFSSKIPQEVLLRELIMLNEYHNATDELPRLFCELAPAIAGGLNVERQEDLAFGFYMAAKRSDCGILKLEAMLRYGNALAESEDFESSKSVINELITSPQILSEEYHVILGCAYGLMSYLLSATGHEIKSDDYYYLSLKMLSEYPNDMRVAVYKRAQSFARKKMFDKALDTLLHDLPNGGMPPETAENIVYEWKEKYNTDL